MGTQLAINCTTVVHDHVLCFEQCIHGLETLIARYGLLYPSDNDLGTSLVTSFILASCRFIIALFNSPSNKYPTR
jgi:hypothetical protein